MSVKKISYHECGEWKVNLLFKVQIVLNLTSKAWVSDWSAFLEFLLIYWFFLKALFQKNVCKWNISKHIYNRLSFSDIEKHATLLFFNQDIDSLS